MAGLVTAVLALAALTFRADKVSSSNLGPPYAPAFRGEVAGPEAMLNSHDGQAFGSLALDPLLSRPEDWSDGRQEMAYRASRPLFGWLVMLTSFGSPQLAAWSLLLWTAVGAGVLALAAFVLGTRWNRDMEWAPLLLLVPGVFGQLWVGGLSDAMATGLALLGVAWWFDRRDWWAIGALCLAVLCRETTLLVVLALLLATDRGRAPRLLLPVGAYAGWVGVVWLRLHALPTDTGQGRLGLPPANFLEVVPSWGWVQVLCAASVVLLAAAAWWRAPNEEVRWLVVVSALFAATLGPAVLSSWDFTRPLLPVTVIGACLLARRTLDLSPATLATAPSTVLSGGRTEQ